MSKQGKRAPSKTPSRRKRPAKQDDKVTFKAFFSRCVNIGKCRASAEQQINVFFKRNGLSDKETSSTYQKMLEKY